MKKKKKSYMKKKPMIKGISAVPKQKKVFTFSKTGGVVEKRQGLKSFISRIVAKDKAKHMTTQDIRAAKREYKRKHGVLK